MKKLILLDVDGVLSIERSVSATTKKPNEYSKNANASSLAKVSIPNARSTHRTHTYRPAVLAALDTMVKSGDVEIRFLTNWGTAAKSVFSAYVGLDNITNMDSDAKSLGVPHLTAIDGFSVHWYKSQAFIREATVREREVLFIDDLINLDLALAWTDLVPPTSGWLKVNPEKGLTMEWIGRIEDWIQGGPVIRKHTLESA
jgi:hypothetical protein